MSCVQRTIMRPVGVESNHLVAVSLNERSKLIINGITGVSYQ